MSHRCKAVPARQSDALIAARNGSTPWSVSTSCSFVHHRRRRSKTLKDGDGEEAGGLEKVISEALAAGTLHHQAPANPAVSSCAALEWCGGVLHPLDYTQLAARPAQSMAALLACGPQHSLGCRHASFSGRQLNVRPMPRVRDDVTGLQAVVDAAETCCTAACELGCSGQSLRSLLQPVMTLDLGAQVLRVVSS
jgi:hypothetical protein